MVVYNNTQSITSETWIMLDTSAETLNLSFQHAAKMLDTMLEANPGFLSGMEQLAEINHDRVGAIGASMSKTVDQLKELDRTDLEATRDFGDIANAKDRTPKEDNLFKMAESCMDKSSFEKAKGDNQSAVEVGNSIKQAIGTKSMDLNRQMKQEKDKEQKEEGIEKEGPGDPRVISGVLTEITEQLKEYLEKPIGKDKGKDEGVEKDGENKDKEVGKEEKDLDKTKVQEKQKEAPEQEKAAPPSDKMADIIKGLKAEGCGLDTMQVVETTSISKAIEGGSKGAVGDNIDSKAVAETKAAQNSKAFTSPTPSKK